MTCVKTRLSLREVAAMAFSLIVAERPGEILLNLDEISVLSENGGELHGDESRGLANCKLKGQEGLYEGTVWWDGNEDHRVFARVNRLRREEGTDHFAVSSKEFMLVPEYYAAACG